MKKLKNLAALLLTAAMLAACGGGGGGGTTGGGSPTDPTDPTEPNEPTPVNAVPTVSQLPVLNYSAADCPRFTSQAQAIAALDLSNANVRKIHDFLKAADADHAFSLFVRRPHDFVNWIVASSATGGKADWIAVGAATHETLHQVDWVLEDCGAAGTYKILLSGQILDTGVQPGTTPSIKVLAPHVDAALKTEPRYRLYVTNAAAGNDLTILLDEFAAYIGGANTERKLFEGNYVPEQNSRTDSNLGGTVNFMLYLQAYLKALNESGDTAPYTAIKNNAALIAVMQKLWAAAEAELEASHPLTEQESKPRMTISTAYLQEVYSPAMLAELNALGITHKPRSHWVGMYLE